MTCTSFYSFLLFVLFLLVPTVVCQIIVPRPAVRPIRGATWRRPASSLQPSAIASLPSASSSALFRQLSTLSPTVRPLISNHSHHPYCNICIGRLQSSFYGWFSFSDAVVSIPGQPNYTCNELDSASREGAVDPAFCPLFPLFNVSRICGCFPLFSPTISQSPAPTIYIPPYLLATNTCGCPLECAGGLAAKRMNKTFSYDEFQGTCADNTSLSTDSFCNPYLCIPAQRYYERICCLPGAGAPTTSPSLTVQPSEQPTLQPSTRYKYPICYICGNSTSRVTKLNVQLTFPGLGPINCSDLEYNGVRGLIPQPYCQSFPFFGLNTTCGCQQGSPLTFAPTISFRPSSSLSPSHLPTGTPSQMPSSFLPTLAPTTSQSPSFIDTINDVCGCPVGCAGGLSAVKVNDTIVATQGLVSCAGLESFDDPAICHPNDCSATQMYYERQCCLPDPPTTSPSLTVHPSDQPTLQPSTRYKNQICHICGNSTLRVTKPNVQLTFPGLDPINCSDLESDGVRGLIPQPYCQSFPFFGLNTSCGCQPGPPLTLAPTISFRPSSSLSPSHLPTQSQLPTPTSVPPASLPGPSQLPTQTTVPPASMPPSTLPAKLSSSFGVAVMPSQSLFTLLIIVVATLFDFAAL